MSDLTYQIIDFEDDRKGLVLKRGNGYGEVSPLPGFSRERFMDVLHEVQHGEHHSPSVLWGFECIELTEAAAKEGLALGDFLNPFALSKVESNALIMGEPGTWISQVESAQENGFRVFKIKLGRFDSAWEIEALSDVGEVLRDGELLRLDANRRWDMETWLSAGREWALLPIEYVEEPLTRLQELSGFHDHTGLFLGMDETFREWPLEQVLHVPGVKALIIKPTLTGRVLPLMDRLMGLKGVSLVFTHTFESAVGRGLVREYARAFAPHVVCGV